MIARATARHFESVALPLVGALALIGAWHWSVIHTQTKVFPSPWAVALGIRELVHRGVLFRYALDSLARVAAGYSLAAVAGVVIGTWMGRSATAASALNPLVQVLRPISPLAWIPLAILLFGIGSLSAVFLIFLGSFFPIVVATMNAVANVPPMYVQAGQNFGLTPRSLMWRVVLPAALPEVLSGLRVALGVAWIVVVAAEMIAVDSGLGYLVIDARNAGKRYDLVVAGMLLIGLIGLVLDVLIRSAERLKSVRWGFRPE